MSSNQVTAKQAVAANLKVDPSGVTSPVSIATAPVLVAGTALIGKVGIDQTTPGTTNAVSAVLTAGAAVIGVVIDQSPPTTANGQVNVSSSAATLVAQRLTRKQLTIVNRQVAPIFVGIATVSTANGFQIDPGGSLTLYTTALIQAITAAASGATEKTHYIETY